MKKLYFALLVLIGATQFSKAQNASQYYFKAKTGIALEDMSSGSNQLLGTVADEAVSLETSFFPFTFAGNTYSTFSVSDDGVVVLGGTQYLPYMYDNYFLQSYGYPPTPINPVFPILLPWGEDLWTAYNGGVTYKITGTAPSRKLVIEFKVASAEDNVESYNKPSRYGFLKVPIPFNMFMVM